MMGRRTAVWGRGPLAAGLLAVLAVALLCAAEAPAADNYWNTYLGNWSTPANWTLGEPTATTNTAIDNGGIVTIDQAGEMCANLFLGEAGAGVGTVQMTGGDLATEWTLVGHAGSGHFTQSDGTHDVELGLVIALGTGSTGVYDLSGGTLSATAVMLFGTFNWSGGTLTGSLLSAKPGGLLSVAHTAEYTGDLGGDGGTVQVDPGRTFTVSGLFGEGTAAKTLTKTGEGTMVFAGSQDHVPGAALNVNAGVARLATDQGTAGTANLTVNVNGGTAELAVTQHLAALSLAGGTAVVTTAGSNALVTPSLSISTPAGAVDLMDNNLVVDYAPAGPSPLGQVVGWLESGQNINAGYWDGPGIRSTTAAWDPTGLTTLGVMDNAEYGWPDLEGTPVDESSVLVKYTYYGDADLDGSTTGDDYFLWLAGFDAAREALAHGGEPTLSGWLYGDFDYSGDVTGDDYFLWLVAFDAARSGATPLSGGGATAIPEPATLGLLALAAMAAVARKRRA